MKQKFTLKHVKKLQSEELVLKTAFDIFKFRQVFC